MSTSVALFEKTIQIGTRLGGEKGKERDHVHTPRLP